MTELTSCARGKSRDSRRGWLIRFVSDAHTIEHLKAAIPDQDREWQEGQLWVAEYWGQILVTLFEDFEMMAHALGRPIIRDTRG